MRRPKAAGWFMPSRRRPTRERQGLVTERRSLANQIDGLLATLGISGDKPLRRDRRVGLAESRTPEGTALPANAVARIERMLDRLELVMTQIADLKTARDAVLTKEATEGEAEKMIRPLAPLKAIGPELATLLVWEAYVRSFPSRKALESYSGMTGTSFKSGSLDREQGIGKAGNHRLRAALVELAWMWRRYQPDSALSKWFRLGDGRGAHPQGDDRRPRPQAAGGAVAFLPARRAARGRGAENPIGPGEAPRRTDGPFPT